jgi:broad specificity phosphatase PhoE
MTTLVLVRHGQASALAEDYDQLSPTGEAQGRKLGLHLGSMLKSETPLRVLVGPRRRHAQTLASMLETAPGSWPEPELLPELDEHHGVQLVKLLTPTYAERDHPFGEAIRAVFAGGPEVHRAVGRMYQVALTAWVRGELEHPEVETWKVFRERTGSFVRAIAAGTDKDTVIAVTSGGAIAAMVAEALGAPDERVLELMWSIKNASVTRLRFGHARFFAPLHSEPGLRSVHLEVFNETGHLGIEDHLHTHV